eukprot:TRINITY_DN12428_c0_g1_i1.p1 TRINITY_DN12428_c0_g1~~TRINITY_DN12428_c0_g1_i1.p1  ORF type:complete len:1233 (-),score=292.41 TRINITY_DN12428_c0_g1_i1:13-3711(-)
MDSVVTQHRTWARYHQNRNVIQLAGDHAQATLGYEINFDVANGVRIPLLASNAVARGSTITHSLKVTVFHTPSRTFLGATRETEPVPDPRDKPTNTATVSITHDCGLMFVTDAADNNLAVVVEFIVNVCTNSVPKVSYAAGWALLPLNLSQTASIKIPMLAGSPRALLFLPTADKEAAKLPNTTLSYSVLALDAPYPPLRLHELWPSDGEVEGDQADLVALKLQQILVIPSEKFFDSLLNEVGFNTAVELGAPPSSQPQLTRVVLRVVAHNGHRPVSGALELALTKTNGCYVFDGAAVLRDVPAAMEVVIVSEIVCEVVMSVPTNARERLPSMAQMQVTRSVVAGWHAARPFAKARPWVLTVHAMPGPGFTHNGNLVFTGHGSKGRGLVQMQFEILDAATPPAIQPLATASPYTSTGTTPRIMPRGMSLPRQASPPHSPQRSVASPPVSVRRSEPPPPLPQPQLTVTLPTPEQRRPETSADVVETATSPHPRIMSPPQYARKPSIKAAPLPEDEGDVIMQQPSLPQTFSPRSTLHAGPLPLAEVLELPRGVQAIILDSGVASITDSMGTQLPLVNTATPMTLDEEAELDGRSCDVVVQLLGYRAIEGAAPASVMCRLQFFAFSPVMTPQLRLQSAGDNAHVFVPEDSDTAGCILRFTIEGLRGLELARYLARRQLAIELTDASGLLPLGSVRVPLRGLLRQKRPVAQVAGEFNLIDSASQTKGRVLLRMANIARQPVPGMDDTRSSGVWVRPIGDTRAAPGLVDRRHARADMMRKLGVLKPVRQSIPPPHADSQAVEQIRAGNKPSTLAHVAQSRATTEVAITAAPGSAYLIEHELTNVLPEDVSYTIHVADEESELAVVTDTTEWRALRAASGRAGHAEEGFFAPGARVLVHAHETIAIPLRFLSLRVGGVRERNIRVSFVSDGAETAALDVHIKPMAPLIDRTMFFDAREKEILRRRVMLDGATAPARVYCDAPDVICEATTVQKQSGGGSVPTRSGAVDLKVRCGKAPEPREFLVVLSEDPYMARVRETWRVQVQPLQWLDVRAMAGQASTSTIVIRGGESTRRVQAFSSQPALLSVDPTDVFELPANGIAPVSIVYRPLTAGQADVRVNIVDVDTRVLVDAWLVSVACTAPAPSRAFDIMVPRAKGVSKRIVLNNPYAYQTAFRLRTDKPQFLKFKSETVNIAANSRDYISLKLLPAPTAGATEEMLVFVTDVDDRVDECLRLTARYT